MSLLSKLPQAEQQFIAEQTHAILKRAEGVEGILKEVTAVFAEKEYGWLEAILDSNWYRFPGEVRNMRFCSEMALKNYLLARALGMRAEYYILTNYGTTGMHHECVVIPGDEAWVLDWSLEGLNARSTKRKLKYKSGIPLVYDNAIRVPEEDILPRVQWLRTREGFLEAVNVGQTLRRKREEGIEIESTIKYHDGMLTLWHVYKNNASILLFYCEQKYNVRTREREEEWGIVTDLVEGKKLPMEQRKQGTTEMLPVTLSEQELRRLQKDIFYEERTRDGNYLYLADIEQHLDTVLCAERNGLANFIDPSMRRGCEEMIKAAEQKDPYFYRNLDRIMFGIKEKVSAGEAREALAKRGFKDEISYLSQHLLPKAQAVFPRETMDRVMTSVFPALE